MGWRVIVQDSAKQSVFGVQDYSQYIAQLTTNLEPSNVAFIDVYDSAGVNKLFSVNKLPGDVAIRFDKSIIYNQSVKMIARLYDAEGVWWSDDFLLQDGVIDIAFRSQGESIGSGELKTFTGSLTQDGQPVSRAVYANTVGGDVPKMLDSTISDAQGNYSLEWRGYAGQIVITAIDDFGEDFLADGLLSIGSRVHPVIPNGYVYEAASSGALGSFEPAWPVVAGGTVSSGEVQLIAKPFYRPKAAGPFTIT